MTELKVQFKNSFKQWIITYVEYQKEAFHDEAAKVGDEEEPRG